MHDTSVSHTVLDQLAHTLDELSPEARKAAVHVLENPRDVGLSTVREIASAAGVKPNTLVRMARTLGFEGYDDFRAPFREDLRQGASGKTFENRVRWLQETRAAGRLGDIYANMVQGALQNIEETFAAISPEAMANAARAIWNAESVYTLGVGVNNANAQNFTYLASTGMVRFHTIPRPGNNPVDDLAFAGPKDILIAMTCKPYRREVIETVSVAREQGVPIVGLSDSPASPILRAADHPFIVASDTPQFFPSSVAMIAVLETLLSHVIAVASPEIQTRVESFHARRFALGLYQDDPADTLTGDHRL